MMREVERKNSLEMFERDQSEDGERLGGRARKVHVYNLSIPALYFSPCPGTTFL